MSRQRLCRVCNKWHDTDEDWPDACLGHFRHAGVSGLTIIKDIEPYRAVGVPGKPVVTSRRHHRDTLRAHGLVEVGNGKMPERQRPTPGNLKRDIDDAIARHGG